LVFFDATPLGVSYMDKTGQVKMNYLIKCDIGRSKYSTTDQKGKTSNSNMRNRLLTNILSRKKTSEGQELEKRSLPRSPRRS
jgi:hypothetical protein